MELSETHLTAQTDSPGPPLGKAVAIARQDKALRCLVHVILRRPYEKALAVYIRDSTSLGFYGTTLCRLLTLGALVHAAVQAGILIASSFDVFGSSATPSAPTTFDVIYFISISVLLFTAFIAIFGVIFYRAYLTVPFIICGMLVFCMLSGLLNYSFFRPLERIYSTFTTVFPESKLNALFDIVLLGVAIYVTLLNIREQVLYDLPPARRHTCKNWE